MDAQLLSTQPESGEFPEVLFDAFGSCLWVKYTDSSYSEWCGVFGCGSYGRSLVLVQPETSKSFVLASGQGYWVDIEERSLLGKTGVDDIQIAIWPDDCDFVIAGSWTNILFLDPMGIVWDSGRVSWDGISFDSYTDGKVVGIANDLSDDGCEFELDVQRKIVVGAPEFPTEAA